MIATRSAAAYAKFDETKRVVAKLMARENITVVVDPTAKTAYFELKTRTLRVPNWKLSLDQCDMLLAHEVGHALFTDATKYETAQKDGEGRPLKGMHHYLNVLEDVRVERAIQATYPGLYGVFRRAYQTFHEQGPVFKGTRRALYNRKTGKMQPIKKLRFIDRINVFYKLRELVDVPFRKSERVFLRRVDRAQTLDDIIVLAHELYTHDREEYERKLREQQERQQNGTEQQETEQNEQATAGTNDRDETDDADEQERFDPEDVDDDYNLPEDENEDKNVGQDGEAAEDGEEDVAPAGDDALPEFDPDLDTKDDALQETIDTTFNVPMLSVQPLPDETMRHYMVGLDEYHAALKLYGTIGIRGLRLTDADPVLNCWQERHKSLVQHMVNEFTRKRAGKVDVRAHMAKTGRLDMSKLAHYKFTDDLFRQIRVQPNGLNHGVVMLIDGSGSMRSVMHHVIEQVILFAHFTQKANIPFQALMFVGMKNKSEGVSGGAPRPTTSLEFEAARKAYPTLTLHPHGERSQYGYGGHHGLVTVVDTSSRVVSFKQQMQALTCLGVKYGMGEGAAGCTDLLKTRVAGMPYSELGSTPLMGSVLLIERVVAKLKDSRRLDRTTLLVLSDGEDEYGVYYTRPDGVVTTMTQHGTPCVLRDAVTKNVYPQFAVVNNGTLESYSGMHNGILSALYDMIAARHNTRVVHMHIVDGWDYDQARHIFLGDQAAWPTECVYESALRDTKNGGQFVVPEGMGVAPITVTVLPETLVLKETEDAVDYPGKSLDAKLRDFRLHAVDAASRRKLVNVLMPYLA